MHIATAPSDYTAFSETRSITSNAMRQCFAVAVVDDDEREHPEKLLVVGGIVDGDFLFSPAETVVWIIDDSSSKEYLIIRLILWSYLLFLCVAFLSYTNLATNNLQLLTK